MRQAILCSFPPDDPFLLSPALVGEFPCPDGAIYFYPIAAGLFIGKDQAVLDQQAQTYATESARRYHFCVAVPCMAPCLGSPSVTELTIVGGTGPFTWNLIGSLPPGLSLIVTDRTALLIGTPLAGGAFEFQLQIFDAIGGYLTKNMTVSVLQITSASIPGYELGVPYSFQLGISGGSGNYAWKISSGSLPTGLTLSLSGLISGTVTTEQTTAFTVTAIDLACQAVDRTFFAPRVGLTGRSTHTTATILGYSEYIASTPPKKYKKLTVSGTHEQIGHVCSNLTSPLVCSGALTQVSGARYEFSGANEINDLGQQVSSYQQLLYAQCFPNPDAWGTSWPAVIAGFPDFTIITLVGYCWPSDPRSCPTCETDFTLLGDISNNTRFPVNDFVPVPGVTTATSITSAGTEKRSVVLDPRVSGFPQPNFSTGFNVVGSAPSGPVVGSTTVLGGVVGTAFGGGLVFSGPSPVSLPAINTGSNIVALIGSSGSEQVNFQYDLGGSLSALVFGSVIAIESGIPLSIAMVTSTANFSAVLSDEYTDAIALANAVRFNSNGLVAESRPRTTGFISKWVTVVFTLALTNLVIGETYVATVDLVNDNFTKVTRTYAFIAEANTKVVSDTVPVPAGGKTIAVKNPQVRFA